MAKVVVEIEDLPEGTSINFKGDLPVTNARDKTGVQQTAVLVSKIIQATQMMVSPIREHQVV